MSPVEIERLMEEVTLFKTLSSEQRSGVAKNSHHLHLARGDYLFEQHNFASHFFLLLRGSVKLFVLSAHGQEKVIEVHNPRSFIGQALLFMEEPIHSLNAMAMEDCDLLAFDLRITVSMLRNSVETLLGFAADVSVGMHRMIQEISGLSLSSGTCRVANFLMAQKPDQSGEIQLKLPKKVLASRLSLKPESLSRILRNLSDRGTVKVDGQVITIQDLDTLQKISDQCE